MFHPLYDLRVIANAFTAWTLRVKGLKGYRVKINITHKRTRFESAAFGGRNGSSILWILSPRRNGEIVNGHYCLDKS